MNIEEQLKVRSGQIGAVFDRLLDGFHPSVVSDAMRYAAKGGKGLRGFLVMESAALFDVPDTKSIFAAAAIEALHAYSLVHDDLPCMDDDDLRRGEPTVHVRWDEATAGLTGDALQALAFELITQGDLPPEVKLELAYDLAVRAGGRGMVRGQALDIAAETSTSPRTMEQIAELQALKTGYLIQWSATAGPFMAGQDPTALNVYAEALGLAFQIADDLLDVTATELEAGKRTGKDADAGKATFVTLLGEDGARSRARELCDQAIAALEPYGAKADLLRDAARFVIERRS